MKVHKLPCVYAIADKDLEYIKIGMTKNIKQRISNVKSGCPFKLSIWMLIRTKTPELVESYLHWKLSEFRLRGEWFSLDEQRKDYLIDFFKARNKETRQGINHALL